jgi:hypothetical protein
VDPFDICDVVVAPTIGDEGHFSSTAALGELRAAAGRDRREGRAALPIFLTGELNERVADGFLDYHLGRPVVVLPADPEEAADVLLAAACRQRES